MARSSHLTQAAKRSRGWARATGPLLTRRPHTLHAPALAMRLRRPWQLVLALTVIAVVAAVLILDRRLILMARELPAGIVDAFNWYTDFGQSGWFLFPLGILYLALWSVALCARTPIAAAVTTACMIRVGFLFAAIAVPGLVVTVVKRIIARARPYLTDAVDPMNFNFPSWDSQFASFPSGHAVTACAAAVAFGALWPRWRALFWLYALGILASRVIITAHYPSDVIGGAAFGAGGALLVRNWFANRRLAFGVTAEGEVRAYPARCFRRLWRGARRALMRLIMP